MMTTNCPVCQSKLSNASKNLECEDQCDINCPQCGKYTLTGSLFSTIDHYLDKEKDGRTKLSHAIRKAQSNPSKLQINTYNIEKILEKTLPKPREQTDLLIRWLANESQGIGESVQINSNKHLSIIGATSLQGLRMIVRYLEKQELIESQESKTIGGPFYAIASLTFEGWDYYEELKNGHINYQRAFMAMKFGNEELDIIVEKHFKPSVLQTGYELVRLDESPVAGLIDDNLRVQIQAADFIIADLSHDNKGAYWEAGYAEGLGKPVIYTCEKEKFNNESTHFDTNHHLTILWESENLDGAIKQLKATIRATFPQSAKLLDE